MSHKISEKSDEARRNTFPWSSSDQNVQKGYPKASKMAIFGKTAIFLTKNTFIPLNFKLFNGVNVFIVELFLLYQTPTTGSALW